MGWSSSVPATEPVTRTEAKAFLKVRSSVTADDDLIDELIKSARQEYEHESGDITTTRTITEYWDDYPTDGRTITLSVGPVASITSVKYRPDSGTLTLIDSSNYTTDLVSTKARIYFDEGYTLPELGDFINRLEVIYTVGVAAASVAETAKTAIKTRIALMHNNRADMPLGGKPGQRTFEVLARRRRRDWV